MEKLLRVIDASGGTGDVVSRDLSKVDFVSSPKNHLMGVNLGKDFLLLDVRSYTSFRIRPNNFNFLKPILLFSYAREFDKAFMAGYFEKNEDNPYAIQYVCNQSRLGTLFVTGSNITQFPPLDYPKPPEWYQQAKDQLIMAALQGDLFFLSIE